MAEQSSLVLHISLRSVFIIVPAFMQMIFSIDDDDDAALRS
jgi:hypothetical protein